MPTLDDCSAYATALDGVTEGDRRGQRIWIAGGKTFAWERTFSKADTKRFGTSPIPAYPVVAVRVADANDKEAVLAAGHAGVFTIEHFNGYNAVLIELNEVEPMVLRELLKDARDWAR